MWAPRPFGGAPACVAWRAVRVRKLTHTCAASTRPWRPPHTGLGRRGLGRGGTRRWRHLVAKVGTSGATGGSYGRPSRIGPAQRLRARRWTGGVDTPHSVLKAGRDRPNIASDLDLEGELERRLLWPLRTERTKEAISNFDTGHLWDDNLTTHVKCMDGRGHFVSETRKLRFDAEEEERVSSASLRKVCDIGECFIEEKRQSPCGCYILVSRVL